MYARRGAENGPNFCFSPKDVAHGSKHPYAAAEVNDIGIRRRPSETVD
jgi:hypothetical protein